MTTIKSLFRGASGTLVRTLGFALALSVVSGCASSPRHSADPAMQAAAQAIGNAERAHAASSAATELAEARNKLASARQAAGDNDTERARRLAHQARVEAELAIALHEVAKARSVNEALRAGIR